MAGAPFRAALAALAAAMIAAPALAQDASSRAPVHGACQSAPPGVDLSRGRTQWRVWESWNDDDLVYTFESDGRFRSSTGHTGGWLQTGARVVIDWPSYRAIYIGAMEGGVIRGTALFDNGQSMGTFELTLIGPSSSLPAPDRRLAARSNDTRS